VLQYCSEVRTGRGLLHADGWWCQAACTSCSLQPQLLPDGACVRAHRTSWPLISVTSTFCEPSRCSKSSCVCKKHGSMRCARCSAGSCLVPIAVLLPSVSSNRKLIPKAKLRSNFVFENPLFPKGALMNARCSSRTVVTRRSSFRRTSDHAVMAVVGMLIILTACAYTETPCESVVPLYCLTVLSVQLTSDNTACAASTLLVL
jgi:hypothetical protein